MNTDNLYSRQSNDAIQIEESISFKRGDWVICGYQEKHWEKYPDSYAPGSKIRPERVDRVELPWVYLQNGMYLSHEHVRFATDTEITEWLQYVESNGKKA